MTATGTMDRRQSGAAGTLSAPLLLPVEAGFRPAEMPLLRKAAILMVALGDELAASMMKSLGEREVERVSAEISRLGEISPELQTQVLTEFYGLLATQHYMGRGGPEYALRLLTEAFGKERAAELLQQIKQMEDRTTGDLAVLQRLDAQQLSKFLENEHPQTVALVLAHLEPAQGSALLMSLAAELRVDVVRRLAEMRQFSPEMAQKVALVLHRRMEALGSNGRRSYSGCRAVADLLNRVEQGASRSILETIENDAPALAIGIRDLMFTFDDLLTVPAASLREIIGACDKRALALAIKGARENVRAHLYRSMSSRAAEMLQEDIEALGPVRARDVQTSQQELLATARRLEAEGKIVLKLEMDFEASL